MSIGPARHQLQHSLLQAYAMQNLDASLGAKVRNIQVRLNGLLARYNGYRRSQEICEIGDALVGLNFGDIESQIILTADEIEMVSTVLVGLRSAGPLQDLPNVVALVVRAVFDR